MQDSSFGKWSLYGHADYVIIVDDTPPNVGYVNDGLGSRYRLSGLPLVDLRELVRVQRSARRHRQLSVGHRHNARRPGCVELHKCRRPDIGHCVRSEPEQWRYKYYVVVKAIDFSGNSSDATDSDGVTVDTTSPASGVVNDGLGADIDFQSSTTAISANWSGFEDNSSGVESYQWAIGLTPGGTSIQDYTDVGSSTSATATGLVLSEKAHIT